MPSVSIFGGAPRSTYVILRETFTGDGSDTTFQLTSSVGNCTFNKGTWDADNVATAYPAHVTGTDKAPTYDSVNPITRNRISVTSITAEGLVTLDYAPRDGVSFYIWYWYGLSTNDEITYYREDFVASMEEQGAAIAGGIATDVTNFNNLLSSADITVQAALETLDDVMTSAERDQIRNINTTTVSTTQWGYLGAMDQDLATTNSPSFVGLSLGTGELTCGSINRASDILTLEIAGTPEVSITSTSITFAGIVIAGAGRIDAGADGTQSGNVNIYGPGDGQQLGGLIDFFVGTSYDDTINFYRFQPYEDDFYIGPDTNTDALKLDAVGDFHITAGTLYVSDLTVSRLVASSATQGLASTDLISWVAGTGNQIIVTDDADGTITLSTPQDIHTGASPTFANVYVPDGGFIGVSGADGWTFDSSNGDISAVSHLGIATTTPNARLEIEDDGTAKDILLKITQDDANVYGLIIGNDTYSVTDTLGLQMYLDNSGHAYCANSAAGSLFLDAIGTINTSDIKLRAEDDIIFQDYNGGSPTTAMNLNLSTATLYIGRSDNYRGVVILYGNGTGSVYGGSMQFRLAADYDATIDYWQMRAQEDDFYMGRNGAPSIIKISGANDEVYIDTDLHIPNMKSGATQVAAGAVAGELWHDTDDDTIKMGV